jgi:hypothetical protein
LRESSAVKNSPISFAFMDYGEAQSRVVKKWYENRIVEETLKNEKLK